MADPGAARRGAPDPDACAAGVRAGDRAMLGRAITLIESRRPDHREAAARLLAQLQPLAGRAHRIGITGIPGVGKSSFIETLGRRLTGQGHRVAVLAVDPTSSRTGGSILGDKTRMQELSRDPRAFIRPSPTAGSLGGVGRVTRETMLLCEAAGHDVVLVETVGVGQSETMVADMVDLFLLLLLPGAGDELQGIKRGVLELADIIAVNKADGDGVARARRAAAEMARALHILAPAGEGGGVPVLTCSALTGEGLAAVWTAIERHRAAAAESGGFQARRRRQQIAWMWALVRERLMRAVDTDPAVRRLLPELEAAVAAGTSSAADAAAAILAAFDPDRLRQT